VWTIFTGDSLAEDYAGENRDTLIFDPPWDKMAIPAGGLERFASVLAFADGRRAGCVISLLGPPTWVFVWDCVSSWWTPGRPLKRHKLCFWYGDISRWQADAYFSAKRNVARLVRNPRGAHMAGDARGTRLSDLYASPITALHSGAHTHAHSKPVEWLQYLLRCTGATSVYDPFCGSGAAVWVARCAGIPAVGVEIDPAVADRARALIERGPERERARQGTLDFATPPRAARRLVPGRSDR